jgi:hypothetical protein
MTTTGVARLAIIPFLSATRFMMDLIRGSLTARPEKHSEHAAKPGSQLRELPVIIAGRKTCPDGRETLPLRACMNMTPGRRRRKKCELSWRFIYAACQLWA